MLQRACASREPGEIERSRTGKGILIDDVRLGPNALLVSDFRVGRSDVKSETKRDPDLQSGIADFERDPSSYELSVLGLDDCFGLEPVREKLRKDRAECVRDLLGPRARQRVAVADGAPLEDYAADNLSAAGRAKNRGAVVTFEQSMQMPPTRITVPKPKYPRRPTWGCTQAQAEELSQAHVIATAMVEKAITSIKGGASAEVKAIMRKYVICDHSLQRPGVTTFPPPNPNDLAVLIIHEASHQFDINIGTQYCDRDGCGPALSTAGAVDNPDSYAYFADEIFTSP